MCAIYQVQAQENVCNNLDNSSNFKSPTHKFSKGRIRWQTPLRRRQTAPPPLQEASPHSHDGALSIWHLGYVNKLNHFKTNQLVLNFILVKKGQYFRRAIYGNMDDIRSGLDMFLEYAIVWEKAYSNCSNKSVYRGIGEVPPASTPCGRHGRKPQRCCYHPLLPPPSHHRHWRRAAANTCTPPRKAATRPSPGGLWTLSVHAWRAFNDHGSGAAERCSGRHGSTDEGLEGGRRRSTVVDFPSCGGGSLPNCSYVDDGLRR